MYLHIRHYNCQTLQCTRSLAANVCTLLCKWIHWSIWRRKQYKPNGCIDQQTRKATAKYTGKKKILPTTNRAWREEQTSQTTMEIEEQTSQTTMEIRNTKKIVWSALPHPLLKYKVSDICVTIYSLYDHAWCHTGWSLWIAAQRRPTNIGCH